MRNIKNDLRKYYKNIRQKMDDKTYKDECIKNNLLKCELYDEASSVLVYVSSDIEVDTYDVISDLFLRKKTVAVPKCDPETCTMKFYVINSFDDLHKGAYGISEPNEGASEVRYDCESLCIVPGLSFDKDGFRLGFGKGYYDRFLDKFPGKTVGLCYDECISDGIVKEKYDKSVSCVITETCIYNIKNNTKNT